METVNRHFLLASGNGNGWLKTDPADYPQDIKIHEIIAYIFPFCIRLVVTFGALGADILITFPLPGIRQRIIQLPGDRNGNFLAGFELFDINSRMQILGSVENCSGDQ